MTTPEPESKRILIIDDEPSFQKLLKTILVRANYKTVSCGSGDEALKMLSQSEFDLIITDSVMPKMTGIQLVTTLRRNSTFQHLPILMLTRKNERADVKKALDAGVTDYILKPIDEFLLLDKVGTLLVKSGGESRLREVTVHGEASRAAVCLDSRIISISESGMVIRVPFAIPLNSSFQLTTTLFKEIGIGSPILKMRSCELRLSNETQMFMDFPYEGNLTFVGITEGESKRIRAWLQKQEIQRKK